MYEIFGSIRTCRKRLSLRVSVPIHRGFSWWLHNIDLFRCPNFLMKGRGERECNNSVAAVYNNNCACKLEGRGERGENAGPALLSLTRLLSSRSLSSNVLEEILRINFTWVASIFMAKLPGILASQDNQTTEYTYLSPWAQETKSCSNIAWSSGKTKDSSSSGHNQGEYISERIKTAPQERLPVRGT